MATFNIRKHLIYGSGLLTVQLNENESIGGLICNKEIHPIVSGDSIQLQETTTLALTVLINNSQLSGITRYERFHVIDEHGSQEINEECEYIGSQYYNGRIHTVIRVINNL